MKFLVLFSDWLNKNQGVLDFIIFIITAVFAWSSGIFKWLKNEALRQNRSSKIICAWRLFLENENKEFLEYEFFPMLQNKTDELIKDFWINFSSSGFDLTLEKTPQTDLFEGWNIGGAALNLVYKDNKKLAPQNFLEPFKIKIKIKKNLPKHDAWIYISYGIPDAKKVELNYRLTYKELERFVKSKNHSGKMFLQYLGATSKSYFRNKIYKLRT